MENTRSLATTSLRCFCAGDITISLMPYPSAKVKISMMFNDCSFISILMFFFEFMVIFIARNLRLFPLVTVKSPNCSFIRSMTWVTTFGSLCDTLLSVTYHTTLMFHLSSCLRRTDHMESLQNFLFVEFQSIMCTILKHMQCIHR